MDKVLAKAPPEATLRELFASCDVQHKGYLAGTEVGKLQKRLVTDLKLEEGEVVRALAEWYNGQKEKLTMEEAFQRLQNHTKTLQGRPHSSMQLSARTGQMVPLNRAEQMIPAARIIYVFQLIKRKLDVDKALIKEIDWCIEQLATGNIYESQLIGEEGRATHGKERELAMPWLAQCTAENVSLEAVQRYLSETGALLEQQSAEAARKDQERVKRRSVLAQDIAGEIQKRQTFLETLESDRFDVLEAERVLGRDKVFPVVAFEVFQRHRLFSRTKLDENAFVAFVSQIRKGYRKENPYHNDLHASDVLQMCHFMLTQGDVARIAKLNALDEAALLLAAIVHDFRHPGVTNSFLQNSAHELAVLYNDRSVLENYHVSEAYKLLRDKDCNLFHNLTSSEQALMRKRIVSAVLATDMVYHHDMMTKLRALISIHGIIAGKNNEKIINPKSEFDSKQFVLDLCLHVADIGNPCRAFGVYKELVLRLLEEFGRQGDVEKSQKLPVTFLCDRTTVNLPVSQLGYIGGITKPMMTMVTEVFPKLRCFLLNALTSEREWKKFSA